MKSVVAIWFRDRGTLERGLPIREVLEHATRYGYLDRELHFLCLGGDDDGCSHLAPLLRRHGAAFHDLRRVRDGFAASFPWLHQYTGRFFDCFLRWLVIEHAAGTGPVLSWDADMFLNAPLSRVHRALAGVTGTASSTCFAAISNHVWFDRYREELTRLETEKESYLDALDRDYRQLHSDGRLGFAHDSSFGRKIARAIETRGSMLEVFQETPEEIFVDRLVRTSRLPQQWFSRVAGHVVCPQLLTLPELHWVTGTEIEHGQRLRPPLRFECRQGRYFLEDQPLLFIHFQGAVFRLCAAHWIRVSTTDWQPLSNLRLKSVLHPGEMTGDIAEEVFRNFFDRVRDPDFKQKATSAGVRIHESGVARRFMLDGDLTEVFNACVSDHAGLWQQANEETANADGG